MNLEANISWHEANQRYLMARLAVVHDALARYTKPTKEPGAGPPVSEVQRNLAEATESMPAPAALDTLCAAFRVSPFERDILMLCAGIEFDSSFAELCASASNGQRVGPSFSLALAALPEPHWSAITPAGPLRRWRLIEVGRSDSLTTSPLRIDERVLHYLTGVSYLDDRLEGLMSAQPVPRELPPSQRPLVDRIAELWQPSEHPVPVIHLAGDDSGSKRSVAAFACVQLGLQLFLMDAANVPASVAEREALARLWEREAALSRGALLVECAEPEKYTVAVSFLQQTRTCLFFASQKPLVLPNRQTARLDVSKISTADQLIFWRNNLGAMASSLNGGLERIVTQFDMGTTEILAASAQLLGDPIGEEEERAEKLWDACRANVRGCLDELAQRIEPSATWSDLVLPPMQLQTLHDIAAQVRHRALVYGSWGFASKNARSLGISALFVGASGTGKTMAAEVLANYLRLDLYRIDLSQVVNKYIGETEKNLRRIFDTAEAGGAILLFDEADALFGKRSDVKDSHDRYANIEVSYLLQRMEAYRGLAILTTNMKSALDQAFMRRIRFIVQFPFPDIGQRTEIWRRTFPPDTPTQNLDCGKLGRLNVAGGNIRNIALTAAFFAAEQGGPVTMAHLLRATRGECAKMEKSLTEGEIGGWV
jgi:ATPase family associated with various cellular activities (AAA)